MERSSYIRERAEIWSDLLKISLDCVLNYEYNHDSYLRKISQNKELPDEITLVVDSRATVESSRSHYHSETLVLDTLDFGLMFPRGVPMGSPLSFLVAEVFNRSAWALGVESLVQSWQRSSLVPLRRRRILRLAWPRQWFTEVPSSSTLLWWLHWVYSGGRWPQP